MTKWFKRLFRNEEGLTLIELIVVVAIIGLLAWLITPRVLEALTTAQNNSANSVGTEVQAALERWAVNNAGNYPDDGGAAVDWDGFKGLVGDTLKLTDGTDDKVVTAAAYTSGGADTFDLDIDFDNGCNIVMDETGITTNTCE